MKYASSLNDLSSHFPNQKLKNMTDLQSHLTKAEAFRMTENRPFVTISYAQSVDGSIATRKKEQIHLSGQQSLGLTHRLRAVFDTILIGIETVIADDPRLTVRLVEGKNPQPVILDTQLRIPADAKLIQRSDLSPWIVSAKNIPKSRKKALECAGATVLPCEIGADGKINLFALMDLLNELEINSVMVEGGARVITSFVNSRLVDQFIITITPKLIGGLQVIDTPGIETVPYLRLGYVEYQHLGEDLIIWARPVWEAE